MRTAAVAAIAVLICACGGAPGSTGQATLPASSTRTSSPLPTSSPVSSLPPVARAAFPPCKLPYLKGAISDTHLIGGFVQGPGGKWTTDPAGGITHSGDFYLTDVKPALRGSAFSSDDSGSYDLAIKRWLPVRRDQVRGDGLAYVYAEPYKAKPSDLLNNATRMHVISPGSGSDRVIYSGAPRGVRAYEREGVYVTSVTYYAGEGGGGLWRLDPATGASTRIPNVEKGWIEAVDHGIAWTDGASIMPRSLLRINLSTGSQATWAHVGDEGWIGFVGLTSKGNPLVVVNRIGASEPTAELFKYTSPTVRTLIAPLSFRQSAVTDNHGTWLTGADGIYLLDPSDKLAKVSDVTGGIVAGGCN